MVKVDEPEAPKSKTLEKKHTEEEIKKSMINYEPDPMTQRSPPG